jgi:hypothetical protein
MRAGAGRFVSSALSPRAVWLRLDDRVGLSALPYRLLMFDRPLVDTWEVHHFRLITCRSLRSTAL